MSQVLKEGVDYYISEGKMVFTAHWLSTRGYCCGNGCRHCPYDYKNVPQPLRAELLSKKMAGSGDDPAKPATSGSSDDPSTPGTSS